MFGQVCYESAFRMPILQDVGTVIVEAEGLPWGREGNWFSEFGAVFKERFIPDFL